jgi:flagellar basal body-associated protein FliL
MNLLQKYKNKPLYEVPEHYFEQLQQDVMQRVMKEEKPQKTKKLWISVVSVAASIAVIVTLSFYIFQNRNSYEYFYAHDEFVTSENEILQDSNCFAEASDTPVESAIHKKTIHKPLSSNASLVAINSNTTKETIVYRAVDYYLDDFTTDSFFEAMYDLECYFDY